MWSRQAMALLLAGTLAVSGAVSGCASKGGGSGGATAEGGAAAETSTSPADDPELAAAEAQLREDNATYNSTVAGGAALGAGLGILTGVLIGATTGRVDNMIRYGIAGGIAGGILGGVDGYMTATAQEASRKRVRQVDIVTRDVEKANEESEKLIASSHQFVELTDARIRKINEQLAQKQIDVETARAKKASLEKSRNGIQEQLANLKKKRDNYQQVAQNMQGQEDTRKLDTEIQTLNQKIAQVEKNLVAMNESLSVSKV